MKGPAPLVRDQHGAILGIDWRRTELAAADVKVPGHVPARAVMPGDTIRHDGQDVVVLTKRAHGAPGVVYIGTRTARGAEVVIERRLTEVIHVVAVGAFDDGPDMRRAERETLCGDCGWMIRAEDLIIPDRFTEGRTWKHAACPAGKFDLTRPVCPGCWTERSVDGSCLCEVA